MARLYSAFLCEYYVHDLILLLRLCLLCVLSHLGTSSRLLYKSYTTLDITERSFRKFRNVLVVQWRVKLSFADGPITNLISIQTQLHILSWVQNLNIVGSQTKNWRLLRLDQLELTDVRSGILIPITPWSRINWGYWTNQLSHSGHSLHTDDWRVTCDLWLGRALSLFPNRKLDLISSIPSSKCKDAQFQFAQNLIFILERKSHLEEK